MAKELSEPAFAWVHKHPPVACVLPAIEEAARETSAAQSGGASAIPNTYSALMHAEGELAHIRQNAMLAHQEPDEALVDAALRRIERCRVAHKKSQTSATVMTKTSTDRTKTLERCFDLINEFTRSGVEVKFDRPSLPKDLVKAIEIESMARPEYREQLREVASAEPTLEEALAEAETRIAELEVTGATEPKVVLVDGRPELRWSMRPINAEPDLPGRVPLQIDSTALMVSLFPDEIRERVFRQIRDFHQRTPEVLRLDAGEKTRRIAVLKAKIAASERLECACVIALAGKDAVALHFPPDVSAYAILGVSAVSSRRT